MVLAVAMRSNLAEIAERGGSLYEAHTFVVDGSGDDDGDDGGQRFPGVRFAPEPHYTDQRWPSDIGLCEDASAQSDSWAACLHVRTLRNQRNYRRLSH